MMSESCSGKTSVLYVAVIANCFVKHHSKELSFCNVNAVSVVSTVYILVEVFLRFTSIVKAV